MRRTTKVYFSYTSVNQLCIDISYVLRTYHKRVLEYVKYIHSSGWYVDHILCLRLRFSEQHTKSLQIILNVTERTCFTADSRYYDRRYSIIRNRIISSLASLFISGSALVWEMPLFPQVSDDQLSTFNK